MPNPYLNRIGFRIISIGAMPASTFTTIASFQMVLFRKDPISFF